jgi:hypothetical protein
MRKLVLAGILTVLACGGSSSGNNNNNNGTGTPGLKTFSYGASQTPTTAQKNTATTAQTQMNNAVKASVNGQVASAASLPSLADSLAGSLPSLLAPPVADPAVIADNGVSLLAHHTAGLTEGCYTFTSSSITYNACVISGSGFSETLNGNLSTSGGTITWNLTVTYSYSAQNVTSNGTYSWSGPLTVTATTITGQGRSAFTGHVVSGSTTYDYQYTAGFDANLTYQTSPSYCINGGTLEIRRTLNATSNATAIPVHDAGIKFTWTGCNQVTVQVGS